ncbi:MAG: response regulator transcription factor [Chloroflexi bacterium]|nr:response regulator transcription factor [Chloroflexota bacterium]MCI0644439.1 response regulator transcription factor [Chloroflexota bacterium]MCI0725397.1 response regulator transcription factor [Chloroflexota bacterium]
MTTVDQVVDILVVEDEPAIADVVSLYLQREGWSVRVARDGQEALEAIDLRRPDLAILDLNLPRVHGLEILRRLRNHPPRDMSRGDVLVVILTDRSEERDRIQGLEMGADDYVAKPFSTAELVSRVKALLRRARWGPAAGAPEKRPLQFGQLMIDPLTRTVRVEGQEVSLTVTEFELLHFLARHPRQVFTREQLLESVWGYNEPLDARTVYVHVRRLRQKIESDPSRPAWLQTVWGTGYKFEPSDSAP